MNNYGTDHYGAIGELLLALSDAVLALYDEPPPRLDVPIREIAELLHAKTRKHRAYRAWGQHGAAAAQEPFSGPAGPPPAPPATQPGNGREKPGERRRDT